MILTSVIKVEPFCITLEDDATGETHVVPVEKFPVMEQGIQMGQIFEVDFENDVICFNEEETASRRAKVASLLARLKRI